MRVPWRARVQEVFARPALLFATRGPDDARQRGAAEAEQRTQTLADGSQKGSVLRENGSPWANHPEPAFQQYRGGRRWLRNHLVFLHIDENKPTQKSPRYSSERSRS